jgi:anti-anti-sigma factor
MGRLNLAMKTAARNISVSIVEAGGVLDVNTVSDFEAVFELLFRNKRFKIVLDLADLDYISSSGIGVLIGNIKEIRKNRGDIRISSVKPEVFKVFSILELPKIFHFYRTEQEAEATF